MNSAIALVLVFVIASALRDVYLGEIFQRLEFFAVVLTAFSLTTVIFMGFLLIRGRSQIAAMRAAWREIVVTNFGTAMAWLSYFFALKLLEPAVVNMLHIGIGPIALIALNLAGIHISGPAVVQKSELVVQGGIVLSLAALGAIVLLQLSGLAGRTASQNLLGIVLALASGVLIALTTDVTKRLNGMGVSAEGVLAVRFIGIVLVAALVVGFRGEKSAIAFEALWPVAAASLVFMVLPLYALQLGVARTSTISVWVVISLSPVCIFAAQFIDGRLTQSPFTLAAIIAYSVLALGSNYLRNFETQPA
jgi:drug/metabolite transporter (DMT)-like permease